MSHDRQGAGAPNFTPGHWEVSHQNEGDCRAIVSDGGKLIALAAYAGGGATQANAHLIAAAPDLYEALEDVVDSWSDDDNIDEDEYIRRISARAALAKARGEA